MANDRDFTFRGTQLDDRLREMRVALPNFDDTVPTEVVAGLIFLDMTAGLYSDNNRVVMSPDYAIWFLPLVEIVDPDIRSLWANSGEEPDTAYNILTAKPFEVSFSLEGMGYPEIIRNKTIKIRVMTEEEAEKLDFGCTTVAPDGKIIQLPSPLDGVRL